MSPVKVPANTAISKILDHSDFGVPHLAMDPHGKNSKFFLGQAFFNASPDLRFATGVEPLTPPGRPGSGLELIEFARIAKVETPLPADEVHGFPVNGSAEKSPDAVRLPQGGNPGPERQEGLFGDIVCVRFAEVAAGLHAAPVDVTLVEYGEYAGHLAGYLKQRMKGAAGGVNPNSA